MKKIQQHLSKVGAMEEELELLVKNDSGKRKRKKKLNL
jgi:hypothetical protein